MKKFFRLSASAIAALCLCCNVSAQQSSTNSIVSGSSDLTTIRQAQRQALQQAREMLGQIQTARDRDNVQAAIREMERSQAALDEAEKSPEKLPAALAAEQNAYQALLKVAPREFQMRRSRNGQGQSSDRQSLEQLEMKQEANRYETERRAAKPQDAQQREQSELAEKLKALAQRQQDVNERLRELQTALQAAKTEKEKEELQRQLKRLRDEERQMLAEMDQMRQQSAQSNAVDSEARRQMDQTRSDMQRAAQQMENDSPSDALAAGTRAQQNLQNLREDLRRQGASRFTQQMREMRNQARDLTRREDEVARALDSLENGPKTLDNSGERQRLAEQMQQQQNALTNLIGNMRAVTEQAEATEPLLSKQLYDTLRRADQSQTENLLRAGARLTERGFLSQAIEAEGAARTNLNSLRQSIERAAESVLGNETEALRYAQRELDDLARQVERELNAQTNSASAAASGNGASGRTNQLAQASQRGASQSTQAGQSEASGQMGSNPSDSSNRESGNTAGGGASRLSEIVRQLSNGGGGGLDGGPITGGNYMNWSERLRDVEQALDQPDLRNQLATVRERVAALRGEFRQQGRPPSGEVLRNQVLTPLAQVRVWLQQELTRQQDPNGLVPLDRDPVPESYSELVRKYYEKLGSAK